MAKLKSLVSEHQSTAVVEPPQQGGFLQQYGAKPLPEVVGGEGGVFVAFAAGKGASLSQFQAAGLNEGDPYLRHADGHFEPLRPLKFMVLDATQFWVECHPGSYDVKAVTQTAPESNQSPFKELVESFLLVFTPSALVPARCTWRTVKTPAIKAAVQALHQASSEEWVKLSPAHAASARVRFPFGRFTATVSMRKRTAKGSGLSYVEAKSVIAPSTMEDMDAIGKYFSDPANEAAAQEVKKAYQSRVDDLRKLVK